MMGGNGMPPAGPRSPSWRFFMVLTRRSMLLGLPAALALLLAPGRALPADDPYDLVIRNGKIVDGTGNPWFYGDVAVRGIEIVAVGRVAVHSLRRVERPEPTSGRQSAVTMSPDGVAGRGLGSLPPFDWRGCANCGVGRPPARLSRAPCQAVSRSDGGEPDPAGTVPAEPTGVVPTVPRSNCAPRPTTGATPRARSTT
jgi:hypothetical protein